MSKILLISHIFPPAIDGGSRVIYQLGQYFESQKHQTLYLSSNCSSTDDFTKSNFLKSKTLKPNQLKISTYYHLRRPLKFINLFIPKNSYIYGLIKVFQKGPIFKLIPFLKTIIKIIKFKPDLIVAGPLPTTTIIYAKFFQKIINKYNKNKKCRLLINASFHQTDPDFFSKPLIQTLKQADFIWTLTQYETNFFIKNFNINPKKLILAGNGIDPNFLIKKTSDKNNPNKKFNILFIGSFSAHKGLDILIKSFATIHHLEPDISLTIAGQKTLFYPKIKKIIQQQSKSVRSQIKFIFNFPQKNLSQIIDNCNLLVLPSSQESFGLVLIEAWARKKPVITTDIPPLREIINQTHGGLIFQDKNSTDLSQKISKTINSPKLHYQLKQNGFNYVKNNYTWPIIGNKICQRIYS